ncbi:MAG: hypothetical protein HN967_12765 [Candidatus Marinimicrobia bacterium]|nr:hypothetical protein [Candidatus Neomarinimicrobiota bacterium]
MKGLKRLQMMVLNFRLIWVLVFVFLMPCFLLSQSNRSDSRSLGKASIRDYDNYTFAGQIGMTVTNYGILGEGYNSCEQPSCRYKLYSEYLQEQIEHFSYAGLWIGGIKNNLPIVSSAIIDGFVSDEYGSRPAGREFTSSADSTDVIRMKSTFSSAVVDPVIRELASYYDSSAVSHQDMIAEFTDTSQVIPGTDIHVPHIPLGVKVHLETYCWNYPYANSFIILNYTVENISGEQIRNPYVGIWVDNSVGNMNYTSICEPGGGWNWYDNRNDYSDSLSLAIQSDLDGDQGWAQSYFGLKYLGSENAVSEEDFDVYYDQWPWNGGQLSGVNHHLTPSGDSEIYDRMHLYPGSEYNTISESASWMSLLTAGPLGNSVDLQFREVVWEPGETINFAFAVVAGLWATDEMSDTEARREILYENANWAQRAYELGYALPGPPPPPNVYLVPDDQQITIYWDNSPEDSLNADAYDPVSNKIDFEGYRIYSGRKTGVGYGQTLLAQYDIIDEFEVPPVGFVNYNTGLDQVRIYDENGNPSTEEFVIEGDTMVFHYKYVDYDLKNGWPGRNWYSVVAYDYGNAEKEIPSAESAAIQSYAIPGTVENPGLKREVGVYPNPYRASADWDGFGQKDRMIWFTNLPPRAEIRIYTLSGEVIDIIDHNSNSYDGSDIRLLNHLVFGKNPTFSGGEHAWDLITRYNQAIATGLYIFSVEDLETRDISIGKFTVIK